ncbi:MAG: TrkH family potassium uptake protein [Candidatus Omnitrophota bacterium]|nr:MAG: TrkH family potassium uptake protein [Candidatus Omnitrophota bacterium]
MILRPQLQDIKIIGQYSGRVILGLGLLMLIPLLVAVCLGEHAAALDFVIAASFCLSAGYVLILICFTHKEPTWKHGMVIVSLSWLLAMFFGAVPLYLSRHWGGYLDACFDAMSGFATTGLTLVQDLDHLSFAHNMWRHLTMYIGGQGIMIVAITFLVRGAGSALPVYVGEARDEKVLPNVVQTARFIWLVSLVYLLVGTLALSVTAFSSGVPAVKSFFHGLWVAMAAWDTGGFAPQSQNILYYHNFTFELITISLMLLGSLNFRLHYALWAGKRKEIFRNIETVSFFISIMLLFGLTAFGLASAGSYPGVSSLFRKGFYQVISAHTGTGYMTIHPLQFVGEWRALSLMGVILCMAMGAGACSTAGGIKILRIGVIFRALLEDIKRTMLPRSAVVMDKIHHIKDIVLGEKLLRQVALITLAYIFLYLLGTLAGIALGYPLKLALFESVSAGANVGLSCGITRPSMPAALKITYIFQMWAGRLEFVSVFALLGTIIALVRGK